MKLDKNTKHCVEVGDYLQFSENERYTVRTVIRNTRGGVSYTITDTKGRTIYAEPSSKLYGAEIIKANDSCPDIRKAYLRQQAKVDDLLMSAMHTLNCIEAFRKGTDTWSDVAEMSRYIEPLTEIVYDLKRYSAQRGVEL